MLVTEQHHMSIQSAVLALTMGFAGLQSIHSLMVYPAKLLCPYKQHEELCCASHSFVIWQTVKSPLIP